MSEPEHPADTLVEALPLKNLTLRWFLSQTDFGRLKRANYVRIQLVKITKTKTFMFLTRTVGNPPNKTYRTSIGFKSSQAPGLDSPPVIKCTCPDFKYRLYFVTALVDALYGRAQGIPSRVPPRITNPTLKNYVCKHLYAATKYLARKKILK